MDTNSDIKESQLWLYLEMEDNSIIYEQKTRHITYAYS